MKYSLILILKISIVLCFISSCDEKKPMLTTSPNGQIEAAFFLIDGQPQFSVQKNGKTILNASHLGLELKGKPDATFEFITSTTNENTATWEPVWDKASKIQDNYKESSYWLKSTLNDPYKLGIIFRIYNDAVAIRYVLPEQENLTDFTIVNDKTSFSFAQDHTFWSANGENHNIGPALLSEYSSVIGTTDEHENSTAIKITKTGHTPVVVNLGDLGYLALLEAAIYDHAYFNLIEGDDTFTLKSSMETSHDETPAKTSWRVILIGDEAGDLVESNTLVNLNPKCAIENPSWIQPGKAVWDWRVWGYKAKDGFIYGLNTPSHKRLIDFASENNIRYLLMDADWYGPEFSEDADPTSANEKINIEENMAYAKSKGVGIILYLNDVGAKRFGLEKILKQFSDWGASGVKYGFMTTQGQEKVRYTRRVVELCAKYKLTVNFHDGPTPPSGDRRTWPNLVTREYGHSQADAKKSYYPETVVNQVFINMITGPLDMCNGWFGFEGAESRDRVFEKIPGTVAAEVAKLAALFSGIHVMPDAPEEYNKKADLFDFLKTLPDTFDELRILDGQLDEFVTVGRRKGENWYIGTLNNRYSREITIDFSFLKEGTSYLATLYADAENSHYENNREAYEVSEIKIKKGDVITIKLASGGGHAIRLMQL